MEAFYQLHTTFDSKLDFKIPFDSAVDTVERFLVTENIVISSVDDNDDKPVKDIHKAAKDIINYLSRKDIGWFNKYDFDKEYLGKSIERSETGAFIYKMIQESFSDIKTERWAADINAIEDAIGNDGNWDESLSYSNGLLNVFDMTREVSNNLKQLNTIIDQTMAQTISGRSVSGIIECFNMWYDGNFMPQYTKLKEVFTAQRRNEILQKLRVRFEDPQTMENMVKEYMLLNGLRPEERDEAVHGITERVLDIERYFNYDYPDTMERIQDKINGFLILMKYQMNYVQSHGKNMLEIITKALMTLHDDEEFMNAGEDDEASQKASYPFILERVSYIDEHSLYKDRVIHKVKSEASLHRYSVSADEAASNMQDMLNIMNNKYSAGKVKEYTERLIGQYGKVRMEDLDVESKDDAMMFFMMAVYADVNGYRISTEEGRFVKAGMEIDRFDIVKGDK